MAAVETEPKHVEADLASIIIPATLWTNFAKTRILKVIKPRNPSQMFDTRCNPAQDEVSQVSQITQTLFTILCKRIRS